MLHVIRHVMCHVIYPRIRGLRADKDKSVYAPTKICDVSCDRQCDVSLDYGDRSDQRLR